MAKSTSSQSPFRVTHQHEDEMSSWIVVEKENRNDIQLPEDDSISCDFAIATASTRDIPFCEIESSKQDDDTNTPTKNKHASELRRSIRKSIGDAFKTPVRAAKAKLQTGSNASSPMVLVENLRKSMTKKESGNRKSHSSNWLEELDLPKNTTREQALVVLLCRELEAIDI
mmetsp:Transcript_39282/g.95041  ORF Transcript_39282/g.95041 Transcript_39282/m.95041 type:complete len:171 (+) Transcript_39282:1136-1648(+)